MMLKQRWFGLMAIILTSGIALLITGGQAFAQSYHNVPSTKTVWLQVFDSCQQAIPGPTFTIYDQAKTIAVPSGPAPGTKRITVGNVHGKCPLQRGNCLTVPTGCVSWAIAIPKHGTMTYTIKQTVVLARWVACDGGLTCRGETVTLTINAAGKVAATTKNILPSGKAVIYPFTGPAFTGAQTDPIVFHDYETPA